MSIMTENLRSLACRHSFILRIIDANCVAQAGYLKDMPVVLAQSESQQVLFLTIDTDEERDDQADTTTVHVFQSVEVQNNGARRGRAGLSVSIHQHFFSKSRDFSL